MGENKTENKMGNADGRQARVPFQTVKEMVLSNIKKEELMDFEHAARLQYRLMLKDSVIRANVEFVRRKIVIMYNPEDADNRMEKTSRKELVAFLAKEGVHVSQSDIEEKDLDYYNDVYLAQYNPPSVREHQPYGYTPVEWKRMKNDYTRKKAQWDKNNKEKFHEWQRKYLQDHPDFAAELSA